MAKPVNPMSPWILAKGTLQAWNDDEAPKLGAALAFYSMLSIGPLLLIAVSIAGLVISHDQAGHYIIQQMRGLVGNDGAKAFETVITNARNTGQGVVGTVIGLVTLLVSAAGFFGQLQAALNTIFNVPKQKTTIGEFIKQRLLSFGMVVGICLLLLTSLVISAALAGFTGLFGDSAPALILQAGNTVLSIVVSAALFAVAFKVLPDVRMHWRDVWVGAALTALLFAIGKSLIGLYLGRSSFSSTYGAAGSLIVLLVWVYYSAQIIFFGAEFTKVYANARGLSFPLKSSVSALTAEKSSSEAKPDDAAEPKAQPGLLTAGVWLVALTGLVTAFQRKARPN